MLIHTDAQIGFKKGRVHGYTDGIRYTSLLGGDPSYPFHLFWDHLMKFHLNPSFRELVNGRTLLLTAPNLWLSLPWKRRRSQQGAECVWRLEGIVCCPTSCYVRSKNATSSDARSPVRSVRSLLGEVF